MTNECHIRIEFVICNRLSFWEWSRCYGAVRYVPSVAITIDQMVDRGETCLTWHITTESNRMHFDLVDSIPNEIPIDPTSVISSLLWFDFNQFYCKTANVLGHSLSHNVNQIHHHGIPCRPICQSLKQRESSGYFIDIRHTALASIVRYSEWMNLTERVHSSHLMLLCRNPFYTLQNLHLNKHENGESVCVCTCACVMATDCATWNSYFICHRQRRQRHRQTEEERKKQIKFTSKWNESNTHTYVLDDTQHTQG